MILRVFLCAWVIVFLVGSNEEVVSQTYVETNDPDLVIEKVLSGIPFISSLTFSPDGRLFALEKNTGNVRILDADSSEVSAHVVNIGEVEQGIEAGAIGLAFSPDYDPAIGGRVYASHVISGATWRVSSFFENGAGVGSDVRTVMDFPDCLPGNGFFDERVHNIENLHFGPNPVDSSPEQVLYVSFGDGGIAPPGQTRDTNPALERDNWCGGIYFLDPAHPPHLPEASSHLFCMGVRNAFDFAFHPISGALYFSENSLSAFDEVNQALFGDHFGWDDSVGPNENPDYVDPIFSQEFPTIAPTGICVYSGLGLPEKYRHQIVFASYNLGEIYLLTLVDPADPRSEVSSFEKILENKTGSSRPLGANEGIVDLTEGPDGWIYFSTGGDPFGPSSVYRIRTRPEKKFAGIRVY